MGHGISRKGQNAIKKAVKNMIAAANFGCRQVKIDALHVCSKRTHKHLKLFMLSPFQHTTKKKKKNEFVTDYHPNTLLNRLSAHMPSTDNGLRRSLTVRALHVSNDWRISTENMDLDSMVLPDQLYKHATRLKVNIDGTDFLDGIYHAFEPIEK